MTEPAPLVIDYVSVRDLGLAATCLTAEPARLFRPQYPGGCRRVVGADFVYVLDIVNREGRTWDNAGLIEDIATGSAAGPSGAFLVANHWRRRATGLRSSKAGLSADPALSESGQRARTPRLTKSKSWAP